MKNKHDRSSNMAATRVLRSMVSTKRPRSTPAEQDDHECHRPKKADAKTRAEKIRVEKTQTDDGRLNDGTAHPVHPVHPVHPHPLSRLPPTLFIPEEGIHVQNPNVMSSNFCVKCLSASVLSQRSYVRELAIRCAQDLGRCTDSSVAYYSETLTAQQRCETVLHIRLKGRKCSPVAVARIVVDVFRETLCVPPLEYCVWCMPVPDAEATYTESLVLWTQSWLNGSYPRRSMGMLARAQCLSTDLNIAVASWSSVDLSGFDDTMVRSCFAEFHSSIKTRLHVQKKLMSVLEDFIIKVEDERETRGQRASRYVLDRACAEEAVFRAFPNDRILASVNCSDGDDDDDKNHHIPGPCPVSGHAGPFVSPVNPSPSWPPPPISMPMPMHVPSANANATSSSREQLAFTDPATAAMANVERRGGEDGGVAMAKVTAVVKELRSYTFPCSSSSKVKKWLEYVGRLPFDRPDTAHTHGDTHGGDGGDHHDWKKKKSELDRARAVLDRVTHGMSSAKAAVLEVVSRLLVAPRSPSRAMLFAGPPGCGKTTFLTRGLGEALRRPVRFIGMGGARDVSFLLGHGYSYEGARPGRLVEEIISAGTSSPVLVMDEIDKISDTPGGREVMHVLMSLVDPTQNMTFMDNYLSGVPLDLSRMLVVFTCNDTSLVDPVLLDRLRVVRVGEPTREEKHETARDYVLPRVARTFGYDSSSCSLLPEDEEERRKVVDTLISATMEDDGDDAGSGRCSGGGGGMRGIEKMVERVMMKAVMRRIDEDEYEDADDINEGINPFRRRREMISLSDVQRVVGDMREERRRATSALAVSAAIRYSMYN